MSVQETNTTLSIYNALSNFPNGLIAEYINTGVSVNDGTGDSFRLAFNKINNNFVLLFNFFNLYFGTTELQPELVSTGVLPNDGKGDSFMVAFTKINNNFANVRNIVSSIEGLGNVNFQPIILGKKYADNWHQAFLKINDNFQQIFDLLNSKITIEVLDPEPLVSQTEITVQTSMVVSDPVVFDLLSTPATNAQEIINIGALPNDGTGDPLRTAFGKINNNFTTLFNTASVPESANTTGNTPGQIIFDTEISNFNSAMFTVRSKDNFANSQNITLSAQISNDNSSVVFSAYGTTFIGTPICRYDMAISGSNLRILCNPITSNNLTHTIYSQLLVEPT